jgi:hypothetical protein
MSCYDEERQPDPRVEGERRGPTVVRDQMNVREIAEQPGAFAGHVRPRYKQGRDDCWPPED